MQKWQNIRESKTKEIKSQKKDDDDRDLLVEKLCRNGYVSRQWTKRGSQWKGLGRCDCISTVADGNVGDNRI